MIKANEKNYVLLVLFCIGLFNSAKAESGHAADNDSGSVKVKRPLYAGIGIGNNISNFRDFATSPLTYSGTAKTVAVFVDRPSDKKDMFIQARYSAGNYKVKDLDYDKEKRSDFKICEHEIGIGTFLHALENQSHIKRKIQHKNWGNI